MFINLSQTSGFFGVQTISFSCLWLKAKQQQNRIQRDHTEEKKPKKPKIHNGSYFVKIILSD